MPIKPTRVTMPQTIESAGKSGCWYDFEIEAMLYPAEEEVRYYPDGSGNPGTPTEVEILGVTVTAYGGSHDIEGITREDRPDWFKLLDLIAMEHVLKDEFQYTDQIMEYNGW